MDEDRRPGDDDLGDALSVLQKILADDAANKAVRGTDQQPICAWAGKEDFYFPSATEPIVHTMEFRDALSEKEYRISGLCQACQDIMFAEPEEGDDDEVWGYDYYDADVDKDEKDLKPGLDF
jgi:hypothetical protein